jgi:outer membrane protein assembly factor BamE (lipoprotein component of BamABCDE complex)
MTLKIAFCCLVFALSTSLMPAAWGKKTPSAAPAATTSASRTPTQKELKATVGMTRDEVVKRLGKPRTASDTSFSYATENEYTGQRGGCFLWFFEKDRVQQVDC